MKQQGMLKDGTATTAPAPTWLAVVFGAALVATPACSTSQPSFDCAKTDNEADKLTCMSEELSSLDAQILKEYEDNKTVLDRILPIQSHNNWLSARNNKWIRDLHGGDEEKIECMKESSNKRYGKIVFYLSERNKFTILYGNKKSICYAVKAVYDSIDIYQPDSIFEYGWTIEDHLKNKMEENGITTINGVPFSQNEEIRVPAPSRKIYAGEVQDVVINGHHTYFAVIDKSATSRSITTDIYMLRNNPILTSIEMAKDDEGTIAISQDDIINSFITNGYDAIDFPHIKTPVKYKVENGYIVKYKQYKGNKKFEYLTSKMEIYKTTRLTQRVIIYQGQHYILSNELGSHILVYKMERSDINGGIKQICHLASGVSISRAEERDNQ